MANPIHLWYPEYILEWKSVMDQRIADLTVYDLTDRELLIHQTEIEHRIKSPLITWALWFFVGWLGGHRYYTGNIVRGILMTVTFGGFGVWYLIDAFFIPATLRENRHAVSNRILIEISAMRPKK